MSGSVRQIERVLQQPERAELERVLASANFRRAPSISRFLAYICERYFEGASEEIKEYNIAIAALGRRSGFDPQSDPIVRVSAHSLRKRLESYYQAEGRDNALRIIVPVGSYVPVFEPAEVDSVPETQLPKLRNPIEPQPASLPPLVAAEGPYLALSSNPTPRTSLSVPETPSAVEPIPAPPRSTPWLTRLTIAGILIVGIALFLAFRLRPQSSEPAFAQAPSASAPVLAVRLGSRQATTDSLGQIWASNLFCQGGQSLHNDPTHIVGADDPGNFAEALTGHFQCAFPVLAGVYELHLYFADQSHAEVAAHRTNLRINGAATQYDIIADQQGEGRAVVKVLLDQQPQSDGAIHIDGADDSAFLSAVEIFRGAPGAMQPIRISAAPRTYTDSSGVSWMSDRYFLGGSQIQRAVQTAGAATPRLFQWERFGRFRYAIPVAAGKPYTVRLYFSEGYFGPDKLVRGGPGSRVFSVFCNGETLLRNFDILTQTQPGHEAIVQTFPHIQPLNDGRIELEFEPVHDYALVNAIEVLQEAAPSAAPSHEP